MTDSDKQYSRHQSEISATLKFAECIRQKPDLTRLLEVSERLEDLANHEDDVRELGHDFGVSAELLDQMLGEVSAAMRTLGLAFLHAISERDAILSQVQGRPDDALRLLQTVGKVFCYDPILRGEV